MYYYYRVENKLDKKSCGRDLKGQLNRKKHQRGGKEPMAKKFSHHFVKTQGFEQTIAFVMTLSQAIWEAMQTKKNFRMVLEYDAEALNANIDFEDIKVSSEDSHPECR